MIESILTYLAMGLILGYIFRRTRNIVAPGLPHILWIVALIPVDALARSHPHHTLRAARGALSAARAASESGE